MNKDMKLLKSNLDLLNNNISLNGINKDLYEWNSLMNSLPLDGRKTIIPKYISDNSENKELIFKDGDKIPGVLDYVSKLKKRLIEKNQKGTEFHWQKNARKKKEAEEREKYLNTVEYGNDESGVYPVYDRTIEKVRSNKSVKLAGPKDKNAGDIVVTANKLGNKEVINTIRQMLPDEKARENLYRLLDPVAPIRFSTDTEEDLKLKINKNDTLANRLKKVSLIYKIFGNNGSANTTNRNRKYVFIDGDRPFVDPINNEIFSRDNSPWHVDTAVFEEIPHLGQVKFGRSILSLIGGDLPHGGGLNGYETYGTAENEAHSVYARAFRDFVFNPKYKSGKDLTNLILKYDNVARLEYTRKLNSNLDNFDLRPYYKKGSKIHIKKKNRGKFTDYCGGTVTQNCINRAKASGNKTLIKRAVFAENSRKWKK